MDEACRSVSIVNSAFQFPLLRLRWILEASKMCLSKKHNQAAEGSGDILEVVRCEK